MVKLNSEQQQLLVSAKPEIFTCVYRKSKSERIDDEVRPVWRANL
jgi:hypothetical protein